MRALKLQFNDPGAKAAGPLNRLKERLSHLYERFVVDPNGLTRRQLEFEFEGSGLRAEAFTVDHEPVHRKFDLDDVACSIHLCLSISSANP